jgi:hypothetical protein
VKQLAKLDKAEREAELAALAAPSRPRG